MKRARHVDNAECGVRNAELKAVDHILLYRLRVVFRIPHAALSHRFRGLESNQHLRVQSAALLPLNYPGIGLIRFEHGEKESNLHGGRVQSPVAYR